MATLTIKQFSSLSKIEKEDVVLNIGIFLLAYRTLSHRYSLYQVSSFYVELVNVLKGKKALIRIIVHPTPESIDNYLQKISIKGIGL